MSNIPVTVCLSVRTPHPKNISMLANDSYFKAIGMLILWLMGHWNIRSDMPVDLDALECDLNVLFEAVGSDLSAVVCEQECGEMVARGHVFHHGCPVVCMTLQKMTRLGHAVWTTTIARSNPCGDVAKHVTEFFTNRKLSNDDVTIMADETCDTRDGKCWPAEHD